MLEGKRGRVALEVGAFISCGALDQVDEHMLTAGAVTKLTAGILEHGDIATTKSERATNMTGPMVRRDVNKVQKFM